MIDYKSNEYDLFSLQEWTPQFRTFLNETRTQLKGSERRLFMARVVFNLGYGGSLRAERELGWDRTTIRKGLAELKSGITCYDNYSGRGRKPVEQHLLNLLEDIVSPISQTDRYGLAGSDHDFEPEAKLKLFGIAIPEWDENYFFFTQSFATSDFMVDALESLWTCIKNRTDLHTIVINSDNGPDNSSRRSRFMNRLVEFVKGIYAKGVKLTKKAMEQLEKGFDRIPGIEKWAVDIPYY